MNCTSQLSNYRPDAQVVKVILISVLTRLIRKAP